MIPTTVEARRWTREEYDRRVEQGFFHPEEKSELVDGVLHGMTPQSSCHATALRLTQIALQALYGEGFDLRCQMPLALDPVSEPEPDLAVVCGGPEDYAAAHPRTALLVVEVADSSLAHDRRKARLYARAGIREFWIVNLLSRCLEVHRDPHGARYESRLLLRAGDSLWPPARPGAALPVASLMPRQ